MANTGIGTNQCLEAGCLPMNVNFYSPIPDLKELEVRKVWERKSGLPGIDFQIDKQLEMICRLGHEYGEECNWPLTPTKDPTQFYLKNNSFSYGCATALHTIIRHFKPRHFIKIGSGFSSRVISKALEINKQENITQTPEYLIIDPYPDEIVASRLSSMSRLFKEKVECVDLEVFDVLDRDDVLFIDSGHTVRTGGDVNFLILDVLPNLHPGVIVHFHDINLPYEYPKVYFTNPKFRVFWTEAYLLQAFLSLNRDFEVMLAMNYIQTEHMEKFCQAFPHFDLAENWANSGSFWIRRR